MIILYNRCNKEGKNLGKPYRCKLFSSRPVPLIAEDHYYGKRDGKCYEIIDYGNRMSFREVSMQKCMTEKEIQDKVQSGEFVQVIYE